MDRIEEGRAEDFPYEIVDAVVAHATLELRTLNIIQTNHFNSLSHEAD